MRDELSRVDPAADPGARVYKLVGPALVPTDLNEARANVSKRLDFIKKEMCVTISSLKTTTSRPFLKILV